MERLFIGLAVGFALPKLVHWGILSPELGQWTSSAVVAFFAAYSPTFVSSFLWRRKKSELVRMLKEFRQVTVGTDVPDKDARRRRDALSARLLDEILRAQVLQPFASLTVALNLETIFNADAKVDAGEETAKPKGD